LEEVPQAIPEDTLEESSEQPTADTTPGAHEPEVVEAPTLLALAPDAALGEEAVLENEPGVTQESEDALITSVIAVAEEKGLLPEPSEPEEQPEALQEVQHAAPSVEITSEPEPKTLPSETPFDETTTRTPVMSRTPSRRTSRSPSKSPMRIEESIEALDALEEALEDVGKAVSHFDKSGDEKSPRKKAPSAVEVAEATQPKLSHPAVAPRSKTPATASLAKKVSRAPSVAPTSNKSTTTSLARASSLRNAPSKDARKSSVETVDYLASKRRPISMSFPTPPPPPKGRAPTKPTFQLSSEAVATKLKAQKEERLKREAEREAEGVVPRQRPVSVSLAPHVKSSKPLTRPTFQLPGEAVAAKLRLQKEEREAGSAAPKPRPVSVSLAPQAKSTKPPTKATFQLPGEAIAAKLRAQKEERQKREAENAQGEQSKVRPVSISMPQPTVKSKKPLTKATFQLPGEAIAAKLRVQREERQKREEEAEVAKAAASKAHPATARRTVTLPTRSQLGVSIPPLHKADNPAPMRSSSLTSKRSSMHISRSVSIASSNRVSILPAKATDSTAEVAQPKLTGRQVFLRDRSENGSKERERKEKEEAAKKARAEAAERGRVASREWADRQRKKMMDAIKPKAGESA
jgi:hypothetical protein